MGTLIVAAAVFAAAALALRSMVRSRKNGKSLQCGGDCGKPRTLPLRKNNRKRKIHVWFIHMWIFVS